MLLLSERDAGSRLPDWAEAFAGLPGPSSVMFQRLCLFCETHQQVVNVTLPWLAAEVGGNDGYATMLEFVRRWGGTRLYVPKDHAVFVARIGCGLGPLTHRRLVREVSHGLQVEVPSAWGVFLALRRVAIAVAIRAKLPPDEISRRFGVTMRSLR